MVNIGIKLYDDTIHLVGDMASEMGAETTITTIVDNQKKAEIEVLASDPAYGEEYFSIGKFIIDNIPPLKAGEPRIILKFYLDAAYTLIVDAISNDVLKKRIKIDKDDWAPGVEFKKPGDQEEEVPGETFTEGEKPEEKILKEKTPEVSTEKVTKEKKTTLFTIDLSEGETKKADDAGQEEDKDDEQDQDSKKKEILIPILLITSIIILIAFVVFFFLVIRPWDISKKDGPEPTQPVATVEVSEDITSDVTEDSASVITEEDTSAAITSETGTGTVEPTEDVTIPDEEESVLIDIEEINRILLSIGPLYFKSDSLNYVDSGEQKKIDRIALSIKEHKSRILLIITGHTAKAGSVKERQALSVERARAVQKALIDRDAITEETSRVEGRGSTEPASTTRGKASLNRRVELKGELLD